MAEKFFNIKWIKTVFGSIFVIAFCTFCFWIYSNVSFPKEAKAQAEISSKVNLLLSKDSVKSIQGVIVNMKLENITAGQEQLKVSVKESKSELLKKVEETNALLINLLTRKDLTKN